MKKAFVLLLLFCAIGATAQTKAETEIRKILAAQTAAWNRGDLESYMMAGYIQNDSLLFLGKNGATYGYDSTLARYRRGYANAAAMGRLRFEILRIEMLGKRAACVAGRWFLSKEKPSSGAFMLILKKGRKGWKIVADHSS